MSLHHLCRFGLLTRETTLFLNEYTKQKSLKIIESKLLESGYVSSKDRAYRIINELKKRFLLETHFLPQIEDLSKITKGKIESTIRAQIYFVYLAYSERFISYILIKLSEIYFSDVNKPEISRTTIKTLLITYLSSNSIKMSKKVIDNWIGRILSIFREINLLVRKKGQDYILNFHGILTETVQFFLLHAVFNHYSILDSEFIRIFHINNASFIQILLNSKNANFQIYKSSDNELENIITFLGFKYQSIQEWAESFI